MQRSLGTLVLGTLILGLYAATLWAAGNNASNQANSPSGMPQAVPRPNMVPPPAWPRGYPYHYYPRYLFGPIYGGFSPNYGGYVPPVFAPTGSLYGPGVVQQFMGAGTTDDDRPANRSHYVTPKKPKNGVDDQQDAAGTDNEKPQAKKAVRHRHKKPAKPDAADEKPADAGDAPAKDK